MGVSEALGKIKNFMGLGGVKVQLQIPGQIELESLNIKGKVFLTSKSDQYIQEIVVKMIEEWTTGRGEGRETQEVDLGDVTIRDAFEIKTGEVKEMEFVLPFERLYKSNSDQLKEKGGAFATLGKLEGMATGEKSEYFIEAVADVKGVAFDPSDKKVVKMIQ